MGVISSIACTVNAAEEDREALGCNSWRALIRKFPRDLAHAHKYAIRVMKFLRVRNLIFLAVLYLLLVCILYHYLWQARTLDMLFEAPGGAEGFRNVHVYSDADGVYYDHPKGVEDSQAVEFNFRRNPAPQGMKVYTGQKRRSNASRREAVRTSKSNSPHFINSTSTVLKQIPMQVQTYSLPQLNPCLHAFYYAWYGNVEVDGEYMHWNHHYMPHWKSSITNQYPKGRHIPPDDIGASFYPKLGCYSSKDPAVISEHMIQLYSAGVGVIAVSWYPAGLSDDEGPPPDPVIPVLLDAAHKHGIKVTLHIEPYKGRTPASVRDDLKYIHSRYTQHPAFYKLERGSTSNIEKRLLPLIYIYDSYLSEASAWAKVFKPGGSLSVRGQGYDCVSIALLVERAHMQFAVDGGFDGVYTYFAADSFSFGSTFSNWGVISKFAAKHGLLYIPSFGPGYNDLQVRPWNKVTSRDRGGGAYYQEGFKNALEHNRGGILSITSFNEWGEGTQIEPPIPKQETRTYLDYSPGEPDFYLELTRIMSEQVAGDCGIT